MILRFFTAICLLTMLTLVGCGDPKKTAKTGKTGDAKTENGKTSQDDDAGKTEPQKTEPEKTEPEKTEPMKEGGDPMPVPEIDPLENTDPDSTKQETGSAAKGDGLKLNKE